MVHGTTLHGVQALAPAQRCQATDLLRPRRRHRRGVPPEAASRPLSIGAVGLGAGTVATFVRPGDSMRFFEIDPLVASR